MDNKMLAKQQNRWKLQIQMNAVMMNTSTEVANFHLTRGKFSFKLSSTFSPMRSYKILKKHCNTASIILKNADHAPE